MMQLECVADKCVALMMMASHLHHILSAAPSVTYITQYVQCYRVLSLRGIETQEDARLSRESNVTFNPPAITLGLL